MYIGMPYWTELGFRILILCWDTAYLNLSSLAKRRALISAECNIEIVWGCCL